MSAAFRATVVVTGATGFIGHHCVRRLLEQGYSVRGTIRDPDLTVDYVRRLGLEASAERRLDFVYADLLSDEGWDAALSGAEVVLHVASPVPLAPPRSEAELIAPARDGTLRVLRAAARAGVRRVVMTSSIAAVLSGAARLPEATFDESCWSDLSGPISAYSKSKFLAERAAWDFTQQLPIDQRFELCALNPSFVVGPHMLGRHNASNDIVRRLVERTIPGIPRIYFPLVDVRDVADAHLTAMLHPSAPGQRFILNAHDCWYGEIAATLRGAGYRVPTLRVGDWLVHVVALFDPAARLILGDLGWAFHPSSEKARQVLGFSPRSLRETLVETAASLST